MIENTRTAILTNGDRAIHYPTIFLIREGFWPESEDEEFAKEPRAPFNRFVPATSIRQSGLFIRWRAAWLVLTGRADALLRD